MKRLLHLALLPLLVAGCYPTRIVTVSPYENYSTGYSTTVTVPKAHTVTTTTQVTPMIDDLSLYLDLHAVGAAFAQSSSVKEFENLLNNSSYMLSNLDLNGDGYVDYLRVLETVQGYNHVFLIQAVLASNVYQDVATVVAELPPYGTSCVEVIGSTYLYGPNYVVRPVFLVTPAIYNYLRPAYYRPWTSPYHWGYFPSYYRRPAPIAISHYHAYVDTFIGNHRYCREVSYVNSVHYTNYVNVTINIQRNDYGKMHPERSFESRTADIPARFGTATGLPGSAGSQRIVNANDIRQLSNASVQKTTASTRAAAASSSSPRATGSSSSAAKSASSSSARSSAASSSSPRAASSSATSSSASSSARSSSASSSSPRAASSSSTSSSASSSARSSSASSSSPRAASSSTKSSSASSSARSTTTTTSSRVKSSGSSNTKISTVSPSGSKSTVSRTSSSASSSARSSSSTSSPRSASTSSSSRSTSSSGSARSTSSSSSSGSSRSTSSSSSSPRSSSSSRR